jgi:hypothetical protein
MTDPTSRFTHQLNNLAEQEAGLAQIVGQAGFFEQKAKQFANKDIFRRYAELYEAYVALVASENRAEKNEALKRALFLQWIGATEPPLLTGVNTLAVPTQFAVLEAVQNLVVEDGLDNEFRWMLDWYYRITDRYFESEISSSLDSPYAGAS